MHTQMMIQPHPAVDGDVQADQALIDCIEASFDCAQTCIACADACLAEDEAHHLKQCIRLDLDCADICETVAKVATRRTGSNITTLRVLLAASAEACRVCAEECESHAEMHEHCAICAEACRRCEMACNALGDLTSPMVQ